MSVSCGCMDIWLVFLTLILLTRFSQRGSLMSGGGQWAHHAPRGCSRLIGISRRWGWPDGGPWSTGGKWMQLRTAPAHAPIPDQPEYVKCGFFLPRDECFNPYPPVQCLSCPVTCSNVSLAPSKLQPHLNTQHPQHKSK